MQQRISCSLHFVSWITLQAFGRMLISSVLFCFIFHIALYLVFYVVYPSQPPFQGRFRCNSARLVASSQRASGCAVKSYLLPLQHSLLSPPRDNKVQWVDLLPVSLQASCLMQLLSLQPVPTSSIMWGHVCTLCPMFDWRSADARAEQSPLKPCRSIYPPRMLMRA